MIEKRNARQLIYGLIYLIVFSFVVFGIYFIWFKPEPTCFDNKKNQDEIGIDCGGSCRSCEIKTLKPFNVSFVKHFPLGDKSVIVAEIENPNPNYGTDNFIYAIDIYSDAGKIKNVEKNSFIYAGEIKNIFETADINNKQIREIKISFSEINWRPVSEFFKPSIQIRKLKTEKEDGDLGVSVSGFLSNTNTFNVSKVKVLAFIFNSAGVMSAASKTELENIPAFEERQFKIILSKNFYIKSATSTAVFDLEAINPDKTKIYVEAIR